jgi:hypothetical protein
MLEESPGGTQILLVADVCKFWVAGGEAIVLTVFYSKATFGESDKGKSVSARHSTPVHRPYGHTAR